MLVLYGNKFLSADLLQGCICKYLNKHNKLVAICKAANFKWQSINRKHLHLLQAAKHKIYAINALPEKETSNKLWIKPVL